MDHIQFDISEEDEHLRTLYCGNLSDKVTEELLYELFVQAGPLEKVTIVPQSTFAFLTFLHAVSVQYSIRLMEGVKLFGKTLNLQPRNKGSDEVSKKLLMKHLEWNEKLNRFYIQDQQLEYLKKYRMNENRNHHNMYNSPFAGAQKQPLLGALSPGFRMQMISNNSFHARSNSNHPFNFIQNFNNFK